MSDEAVVHERRRQIVETKFRQYEAARDRRAEQGFAPVRCCCDCHLLGWLPITPGTSAAMVEAPTLRHMRLEAGEFVQEGDLVLQWLSVTFGHHHTGRGFMHVETEQSKEKAWQSRDYTLEQLAQFPGFEEPTDRERELDPVSNTHGST